MLWENGAPRKKNKNPVCSTTSEGSNTDKYFLEYGKSIQNY